MVVPGEAMDAEQERILIQNPRQVKWFATFMTKAAPDWSGFCHEEAENVG
jgi:hypothetical protein